MPLRDRRALPAESRLQMFVEHLTIETPEQIPLEFPLAGVGSRFLALALDTLIQLAAALLLGFVALLVFAAAAKTVPHQGIWVAAIFIFLAFGLQFGYFAFFEAVQNGQTPGKRQMHLRVIKDDGRPITAYDSVARNLLRIVDNLPGFYVVGILSILISRQNKRLGDFLAGTVVVHETPLESPPSTFDQAKRQESAWPVRSIAPGSVLNLSEYSPPKRTEPADEGPSGYDAKRLSTEEFGLMETFLIRRGQLAPEVRMQLARSILARIATTLEIRDDDFARPEKLIEKLASEYQR